MTDFYDKIAPHLDPGPLYIVEVSDKPMELDEAIKRAEQLGKTEIIQLGPDLTRAFRYPEAHHREQLERYQRESDERFLESLKVDTTDPL